LKFLKILPSAHKKSSLAAKSLTNRLRSSLLIDYFQSLVSLFIFNLNQHSKIMTILGNSPQSQLRQTVIWHFCSIVCATVTSTWSLATPTIYCSLVLSSDRPFQKWKCSYWKMLILGRDP